MISDALNIIAARKLIFPERENLSRASERATGRSREGEDPQEARPSTRTIPARCHWRCGRTTMNFWLPHRNLGSASRQPNRNPSDRLYHLADLRRRMPGLLNGGRTRNERRKRRALERETPGVAVAGGCLRQGQGEREKEREGWERAERRARGSGGWRQIESRARRDRPREHRRVCTVKITTRLCGPQYVLPTLRGSRGIRQRRISRRRRTDDEIPDVEGSDSLSCSGFSSSRATRFDARASKVRLILWCTTKTIPVASFTGTFKRLRLF